jgi:hypothetical protein
MGTLLGLTSPISLFRRLETAYSSLILVLLRMSPPSVTAGSIS